MCIADEKIGNVFRAEFPEIVFEVFSENGHINEKSVMFTVFADGETVSAERSNILEFAATVFDEVFKQESSDSPVEMVFFGLLTHEE